MKPTQLALKPSRLLAYILYLGSGEFFRFCSSDVHAIYLAIQSRIALDDYFCDGLFSPSDAPINSDQYAH
jgi:hypothetical protein